MTTWAPSSMNRSTVPRPMPATPPVTIATFPSNSDLTGVPLDSVTVRHALVEPGFADTCLCQRCVHAGEPFEVEVELYLVLADGAPVDEHVPHAARRFARQPFAIGRQVA